MLVCVIVMVPLKCVEQPTNGASVRSLLQIAVS